DLEAELEELGLDDRVVQAGDDRVTQLRLDVGRKALGRGESLPRVHGDALQAQLVHGGNVGQQRRALGARDRERAKLARLDLRKAGVDVHKRRVHLASDEI